MPIFAANLGNVLFKFLYGPFNVIQHSDLLMSCKTQSILLYFCLRIFTCMKELRRERAIHFCPSEANDLEF